MNLVLDRMIIRNFKGIQDMEISFGKTTEISARNGLGKTTIADAFYWVLFNKDSSGNAPGSDNFREKPLDVNGSEIHGLETSVELQCRLDGETLILCRFQVENWTKKRGQAEQVFSGNVSTYTINGVKVGVNEFKQRVASICDENVFSMIATMSAFNAADWKKRRSILVSMSGVDVDGHLLQLPEYADLAAEISSRNVAPDDIKKVLQDHLRRLNADALTFPVRIDEASRNIPHMTDAEIQDAEYLANDRQERIDQLDQLIASERSSAGDNSLHRLMEVQRDILSIQDEAKRARRAEISEIESAIANKENAMFLAIRNLDATKKNLETVRNFFGEALAKRDALRERYSEEYAKKFVPPDVETVCPTCGQEIPMERIQATIDNAEKEFAEKRKATLDEIKEQGAKFNSEIADYQNRCRDIEQQIKSAEDAQVEDGKILAELRAKKVSIDSAPFAYETDPHIIALNEELAGLVQSRVAEPSEHLKSLESERDQAKEALEKAKAVLMRRDIGSELEKRIVLLREQMQENGVKIAEAEKLIILAEKFVADRCRYLEESINSLFPTITWKLFNNQINGGVTDCCVCMIPCNGVSVPYASANTASQLHADIEIINALSDYYETQLPLIFDNRERVNFVPATKGQLITLAVSNDETMQVNVIE